MSGVSGYRRWWRCLVALSAAGCLAPIGPPLASAATISVDTTHDELNGDGDCSLREAVQAANTNAVVSGCEPGDPDEDTLDLPVGNFALLGSDGDDANQDGDLDVTESLAVSGADRFATVIDAGFGDRALDVLDGPNPVSLTVSGLSLQNGIAPDDGGSIRSAAADSTVTLDGLVLAANRSGDDGGAVFAAGNLTVTSTNLDGNRALGNGGAIASRGTLSIEATAFHRNAAEGVGGSVDSTDGVSIASGTCLCDGTASNGGGIAHRSEQTLTVDDSGISDNRAIYDPDTETGGQGAGLFATASGPVSITGSEISGNLGASPENTLTHAGFGGAIHMNAGAPLTLTDSAMERNSGFNGGAIFTPGDLTATNTRFLSNTAGKFGGAIMESAAAPGVRIEINGGEFNGNESGVRTIDSGGAIYAQSVSESGEGGPELEVSGATFQENVAHGLDGGAISAADGTAISVSQSTFAGNTARGGGAFDLFAGASLELVNSTLVGNRAVRNAEFGFDGIGGAILIEGDAGEVSISNTTIAYNTAEDAGGGIGGEGIGGEATIDRSILAFNLVDHRRSNCGGTGDFVSGGHNVESYDSCGFSPGAPAFDLPNTNPRLEALADNGGTSKTMGLYAGSPALDAVPPADCPPPAEDQRGTSRPRGASCDIGAFEGTVPGPRATCAGRRVTIVGVPRKPDFGTDAFEQVILIGTTGSDVISGRALDDFIDGGDGQDAICGKGGNDRLRGGDGRDRLSGNGQNDNLVGGGGGDRVAGGKGNDVLSGGKGKDVLRGGPGDDWLFGGHSDRLRGGPGKDRLLARRPRIPAKIRIHVRFTNDPSHSAVYYGRVRSKKTACVRNRTVVLSNEIFPDGLTPATTNERGRWEVPTEGIFGVDTYATANRAVRDRFICVQARSDPARVPGF